MKSIYLLCIMLGVLFCRCAEDKGNYDYTPVDELTITGIDGTYTKIVGDSLKIPVTFEHTVRERMKITNIFGRWMGRK